MKRMTSIIVLDYKSAENTINYIEHLINKISPGEQVSFVIVDNSVEEKNWERLKSIAVDCEEKIEGKLTLIYSKWKETTIPVVLCKNAVNGGYAKGNNIGARYAIEYLKADLLVISNNDIEVLDSEISFCKFKHILEDDKSIGCIGPRIVGKDGKDQSPAKYISIYKRWIRMGLLYPLGRVFHCSAEDLMQNANSGVVYRVMGSFFLITADAFLTCEGFDEGTFLFAEEPILAERLMQNGFKTYYYREIAILHNHGETIGKTHNETKKLKLRFESEVYYYRKYKKTKRFTILVAKVVFLLFLCKYKLVSYLKVK